MSKLFDRWYEEGREAEDHARAEESAGRAADAEAALDFRDETKKKREWMFGNWEDLGGNVATSEYRFEVLDNQISILKENAVGDRCIGAIYNPFDAHRIADILRMHVPLIKSLEAAMAVVRTVDTNKSPETTKFYTEANLLLEMLKAKEAKPEVIR